MFRNVLVNTMLLVFMNAYLSFLFSKKRVREAFLAIGRSAIYNKKKEEAKIFSKFHPKQVKEFQSIKLSHIYQQQ